MDEKLKLNQNTKLITIAIANKHPFKKAAIMLLLIFSSSSTSIPTLKPCPYRLINGIFLASLFVPKRGLYLQVIAQTSKIYNLRQSNELGP